MPREAHDIRSLIVALNGDVGLAYAGRVGTGYGEAERARLAAQLWARTPAHPLVDLPHGALAVHAGLHCEVSFVERTRAGVVRASVFERLTDEE